MNQNNKCIRHEHPMRYFNLVAIFVDINNVNDSTLMIIFHAEHLSHKALCLVQNFRNTQLPLSHQLYLHRLGVSTSLASHRCCLTAKSLTDKLLGRGQKQHGNFTKRIRMNDCCVQHKPHTHREHNNQSK